MQLEFQSPIKILTIFFILIIFSSFTNKLNTTFLDSLKNNTFMKHSMIFLSIVILITLIYPNISSLKLVLNSIIAFVLFILINKTSGHTSTILILFLFAIYFYKYHIDKQNNRINKSDVINEYDIYKKISKNTFDDKLLTCSFIIVVVIAALIYENLKFNESINTTQRGGAQNKMKYTNNFSLLNFLFN